jgi:uncharacterized membrane protein YqjE
MLGNSISKFFKLDNLVSNLTGYLETKVELMKVEMKENLAESLGKTITYLLIAFVVAMFLLFFSLGVAIELADRFGNFWGFGFVALFYILVGIILLVNHKKLSKKITTQLSETFKKKK